MIRVWIWKMKTRWKSTKYVLWDKRDGIPPIVLAYLILAGLAAFVFTMYPKEVMALGAAGVVYLLGKKVIQVSQNLVFSAKATAATQRATKHRTVHIIKGQPRVPSAPRSLWERLFTRTTPLPRRSASDPHLAKTQPVKVRRKPAR